MDQLLNWRTQSERSKEKKKKKPSDGKVDERTRQCVLLQIDVLSGAGVLHMLLVIFLEGPTK